MKKILFILIFSFLFFTNANAKTYKVHVKHYKLLKSFHGVSKKSFFSAEHNAKIDCKIYAGRMGARADGCLVFARQSFTTMQTLNGTEFEEVVYRKNVLEYEAKLKKEKDDKKKAKDKILAEKENKKREKKEQEMKNLISKLEKKYGSKCETGIFNPKGFEKGSEDYNKCLTNKYNEEQKIILAKQKEAERLKIVEAEKIKKEKQLLANMGPEERSSYKCENTYGFRKGTSKFKECLFKMYQAEIELEKLKIQNENQKQKLALEREKLKASQAQAEAANAQAVAAREQAEAAKRNAEANESRAATADYERRREMGEKGLRSLSGECSLLRGNC